MIQNYRQESGKCRACWNAALATDVQVNAMGDKSQMTAKCCRYESAAVGDGKDKFGFDCIEIPGATKNGNEATPSRVCGSGGGLATAAAVGEKTICSKFLSYSDLQRD